MAAIRIESSLGGNSRLKSSVAVCGGHCTGAARRAVRGAVGRTRLEHRARKGSGPGGRVAGRRTTMEVIGASMAASAPLTEDLAAKGAESVPEADAKNRVAAVAWSLLRPDLPLLVLTVSTLVVSVLVTLGFPLALGDLFDIIRSSLAASAAAGTTPDVLPLWNTGIGTYVGLARRAMETAPPEFYPTLFRLCGCLVLSSMGNAASAYLASVLGERYGKRLRQQTMRRMMEKNQLFYDSHSRGELISRLNADCTAVQTTLTDFLGQRGVRSVIEILFSLIIITIKNPLSAFVSIVVTPAITLAMRGIVKRSAALTVERQEAAAASLAFATERIAHVQTVQLFGQQEREGRAYQEYCDAEYAIAKQAAWFQGLVEGAGRFAVNMGALSLLAIGGVLVLSGRMQVGTLLAFQVYNFFLTIGLGSLSASLGDLGKVSGSLARLEEILRMDDGYTTVGEFGEPGAPGAEYDPVAEERPAASIRFENVWFKYPKSDDWVLKDISFQANPGDAVALVGQSGSGKSTIAALLLGLYEPQRGSIFVDEEQLTRENMDRLRSKVGTMFQQPGIMSGTIEEQIKMGKPGATDEEIARAVELSHCREFVNAISSSGLSYDVGERGKNLSGGQQQRIALARALVRRPQLLVLDEPTAALDTASERFIDMTLKELKCTKVIIAHRLSTIRNADAILVVENGSIVERGTHAELVGRQGGKYANMLSF